MEQSGLVENIIKPILRFGYYRFYRKKVFREIKIKRTQNKLIKEYYNYDDKKLIVFLVPGADQITGKDTISGGVLSIASLCKETANLKNIHDSQVIMCTVASHPLLLKHTNFENDIAVFRFEQLSYFFKHLSSLILHVPEYLVDEFGKKNKKKDLIFFQKIYDFQINILNQNIRLMPPREAIDSLRKLTENITITTAHKKYCTKELRESFGTPLHFFSTFTSPENYKFTLFRNKKNLLLLSPDDMEKNKEIIKLLSDKLPNLQTQVIKGLKYQSYKELIGTAKWSITLGEGLDFYFIEPVFSGAISFAVYNEQFFTESFQNLRTVYKSYEALLNQIVEDIQSLDNFHDFESYQKEEFDKCSYLYSHESYRKNVAAFYKHEYTFK